MPVRPDVDWIKQWDFAHRGLHEAGTDRIENSLAAAKAALEAGFGIECDVQPSRDHKPVVFHDAKLDRLPHETGLVRHRLMQDLQSARLLSDERIPSLTDLLDLTLGRVPLLIEMKHDGWRPPNSAVQYVRETLKTVANYNGPFALMSFEPEIVRALRQLAPDIPRGIVSENHQSAKDWRYLSLKERLYRRNLAHLHETAPHFIAYNCQHLPERKITQLRALGLPIASWTVRSDQMAERTRKHADALIFEQMTPRSRSWGKAPDQTLAIELKRPGRSPVNRYGRENAHDRELTDRRSNHCC